MEEAEICETMSFLIKGISLKGRLVLVFSFFFYDSMSYSYY